MTNTAPQKINSSASTTGQRISTHPSYTEYSWDSLAQRSARPVQQPVPRQNPNARPRAMRQAVQPSARPKQMNSAAAGVRRPVSAPVGQQAAARARTEAQARVEARRRYEEQQLARAEAKVNKKAVKHRTRVKTKSITQLHTIMSEKRYSFPLSIVLLALAFTVLIMTIVTTSAEINEITSENSSLQREYASLVAAENELRLQLETRDDLRTVETMATNELGMVKKDEVQRYYLTVRREDRIELVEEQSTDEGSLFDGLLEFGSSIAARVRAFFGF